MCFYLLFTRARPSIKDCFNNSWLQDAYLMRLRRQTLTFTTTSLKEFLAEQQRRRDATATKHKVLLRSYQSSPQSPNVPTSPTAPVTHWTQASKHQLAGLKEGRRNTEQDQTFGREVNWSLHDWAVELGWQKTKKKKSSNQQWLWSTETILLFLSGKEDLKILSHLRKLLHSYKSDFFLNMVDLVRTVQGRMFKLVPQGL